MFNHAYQVMRDNQGEGNHMKMQIITVAAAALMAVPMLHAQQTTPAPAGQHRGHNGMMKDLGLTTDQQARMKAIHEKYAPQMKTAMTSSKPDFDAMRAARSKGDSAGMRAARAKLRSDMAPGQKVREQEMSEMRGVLTADQQKKFDAKRTQMKANAGKWHHRGGKGMRTRPGTPATPAGSNS
jgi:Spy/CpxP family protein refolding chaperone